MIHTMQQAKTTTEKLQKKVASQIQHENFGEMGARSGFLINISSERKSRQAFVDNLAKTMPVFNETALVLDKMQDITENLLQLAKHARYNVIDQLDYTGMAADLLKTGIDYMNSSMDGSYIFSGTQKDTLPVDIDQLPDPNNYNLDDTDDNSALSLQYFQGDSFNRHARLSPSHLRKVSLTGDAVYFQQFIRSAHILSTIDPADGNINQKLDESIRIGIKALKGLRTAEAEWGQTQQLMHDIQDATNDQIHRLKELENQENFADPINAITDLIAIGPAYTASASALKESFENTEIFIKLLSHF